MVCNHGDGIVVLTCARAAYADSCTPTGYTLITGQVNMWYQPWSLTPADRGVGAKALLGTWVSL